ncbi:MAG: phosphoribosylglycinamide formyltransferase [Bacillota bacterium]
MLNLGVLASGRGSNLQSIIDTVEAGSLKAEIKVVISDRENARALQRAKNHDLKNIFINPKNFPGKKAYEKKLIAVLEESEVELVVLAGFMRLLSPCFVQNYQHQIMNIHPSLLPAFPGLNAQRQALEYGVKVSGCTIHFVDEGMDSGPIILQEAVSIREDDTVKSLSHRILKKEHQIYPRAIKLYAQDRLKVHNRRVIISSGGEQ